MVDWIQLDKTSGGSGKTIVTVTASSYSELIQRVTNLTVTTTGGIIQDINISQNPYTLPTGITVNPLTLTWEQSGGFQYLHIYAEHNWTWTEFPDWVSVSDPYVTGGTAGNHTVAVYAAANPSTSALSGRFAIKCGNEYAYVNCVQAPYIEPISISVSPTSLDVPQNGSSYTVTVTCSGNWMITEIPDWCSASQTTGFGDRTITVTVFVNTNIEERLGDIVFKDKSGVNSAEISIVQDGIPHLVVDPEELEFVATGESKTFDIIANTDWTISSHSSWVTISASSGTGNATITVNAAENEELDLRNGFITVSYNLGSVNVMLSQLGSRYLSISPTAITSTESGKTVTITVSSNADWTVTSQVDWVTASVRSGFGNGTFTVTVDENTDPYERSGIVVVQSFRLSETISVEQEKATFLRVTPEEETIEPYYTEGQLFVESSSDWVANVIETTGAGTLDDSIMYKFNSPTSHLTSFSRPNGYVFNGVRSTAYNQTITANTIIYAYGKQLDIDFTSWDTISEKGKGVVEIRIGKNVDYNIIGNVGLGAYFTNTTLIESYAETAPTFKSPRYVHFADYGVVRYPEGADYSSWKSMSCFANWAFNDEIKISEESASTSYFGGQKQVTVITAGAWSASTDCDWITLSTNSGNGVTTINYTVNESSGDADRVGHITFTGGNTKVLTVTEYGNLPTP